MNNRRTHRPATAILLAALAGMPAGAASASDWITATGGLWDDPANWNAGVPDGELAAAVFGVGFPSGDTAVVGLGGASITVNSILAEQLGALTLSNGTLVFDAATPGSGASLATGDGSGMLSLNTNLVLNDVLRLDAGAGSTIRQVALLSGAADITAGGAGTVVLDGDLSAWTGALTVESGRVIIANSDALGQAGVSTILGGVVDLNASIAESWMALGGTLNIHSITLSGDVTLSGDALLQSAGGTLSGQLDLAAGNTARVRVDPSRTLLITGGTTGLGALMVDGPGTVRLAEMPLAHGGDFAMHDGEVRLETAAQFGGEMRVHGGTLNILGTGSLSGIGGAVVVEQGGRLIVRESAGSDAGLNSVAAQSVRLDGGTFQLAEDADLAAFLHADSTGGLFLLNTPFNYTAGGTHALDLNTLPGGENLMLGAASNSFYAASLVITPHASDHTLRFGGGSATLRLRGAITDHGTDATHVSVTGPSITHFSAASSYTGETVIHSGTLFASHPDALGAGSVTRVLGGQLRINGDVNEAIVLDGGMLRLLNTDTYTMPIDLIDGTVLAGTESGYVHATLDGPITVQAGGSALLDGTFTLSGGVSGTGGLSWLLGDSYDSPISVVNAPLTFDGGLVVDSEYDFYRLELRAPSTYDGVTELSTADFAVYDPMGLGSTAGGTVVHSGRLDIHAQTQEDLTLHPDGLIYLWAGGDIASLTSHGGLFSYFDPFDGPITLVEGQTRVAGYNGRIDSVIEGAGDLAIGHITVYSANTYTGTTYVVDQNTIASHAMALGAVSGETVVQSGELIIDVASLEPIRVTGGMVNFRATDGPNLNPVVLDGGAAYAEADHLGPVSVLSQSVLRGGRFAGEITGDADLTLGSTGYPLALTIAGAQPYTGVVWSASGQTVYEQADAFNHAELVGHSGVELRLLDGLERTVVFKGGELHLENAATLDGLWAVGTLGGPGDVVAQRLFLDGANEANQPGGRITVQEFLVLTGQQLLSSSIHGAGDLYLLGGAPHLVADLSDFSGDIHLAQGVWFGRNDNTFGGASTTIRFTSGSTATLRAEEDVVIGSDIDATAVRFARIIGHTTGTLHLGTGLELDANGLTVAGPILAHDLTLFRSGGNTGLPGPGLIGSDYTGVTGTLTLTPYSQAAPTSEEPFARLHLAEQAGLHEIDTMVVAGTAQLFLDNDYNRNSGVSIASQDRLGDDVEIVSDGGLVWLRGHRTQSVTETLGMIVLREGRTVVMNEAVGASSTLLITELQRQGHSTIGFRDDNTNAQTRLLNAGVAPGEMIGPWATTEDGFATVDAMGHVTTLGFTAPNINVGTATDHVSISVMQTLNADNTIGSLRISDNISNPLISLGGNTLTIETGGVFLDRQGHFYYGTLTSGTDELIFSSAPDDGQSRGGQRLALENDITDNTSPVALVLSSIDADFSGGFTYTGGTFVQNSIVEIINTQAIPAGGDLHLFNSNYTYRTGGATGSVDYGTIILEDSTFNTSINYDVSFNALHLRGGEIGSVRLAGDGTIIHDGQGATRITSLLPDFEGEVIVESGYFSVRRFSDEIAITVNGGLFEAWQQVSSAGVALTLAGGAIVGEEYAYLRDIHVASDSALLDVVVASNITGDGQLTVGRHLGRGFVVNRGNGADLSQANLAGFTGDWRVEAGTLLARPEVDGLGTGDVTLLLGATLELVGDSDNSPTPGNILFDGGGTIYAHGRATLLGDVDASGIVGLGVEQAASNHLELAGQVRLRDGLSILGSSEGNDSASGRSDVILSGEVLVGSDVRWNPQLTRVQITGTVRPDADDASILFASLISIPASTATFDTTTGRTLTLLDDIGAGSLTLHSGGRIVGDGTLRAEVVVDADGFIAPGHSIGELTIDGEVTLNAGSALLMEFEDNAQPAGRGFDRLNVSGVFTARGDLDLTALEGFAPNIGDHFDIVSALSVEGSFDRVLGSSIGNELGLSVSYLGDVIRVEAGLLGDLTGDGFVGVQDLDLLLANWGDAADAGDWRAGDADGNGLIGQSDLAIVLNHWSNGAPPDTSIPEPASLTMLILSTLAATRRRRRAVGGIR